jgi:hypothetical protein
MAKRIFATIDRNGDGKVDLGYRSDCGAAQPKWRYHVSTGSAFTTVCSTTYDF